MSDSEPDVLLDLAPAERWLFWALQADPAVGALTPPEWGAACEVALRTFTAPLLHATLVRSGLLHHAPEVVAIRLARARAWSAERWDLSFRQVTTLARTLAAVDVPVMVLKGGHTGHLYAERGARASGDLDILVRPEHLARTELAMRAAGYVADDAQGGDADHDPDHRHLPALRIADGLPVEVHWTFARRTGTPSWSHGIWERATPLPDGVALGMDPVDLLLYTCKHLASDHAFSTANGLAGLADLRVILAAHPLAPAVVRERAEAWGVRPAVYLCLLLARRLLGAPIPPALEAALAVDGAEEAARSAVWTLLHVGGLGATRHLQLGSRPTLVPGPPVSAVGGPRKLRAVAAYLHRIALPDLDDLRLEYPALGGPLARLGYPIHWSRAAWRHAGLVRLLDPRTRAEVRSTMHRHQRLLRGWLGAPRA